MTSPCGVVLVCGIMTVLGKVYGTGQIVPVRATLLVGLCGREFPFLTPGGKA